MAGLLGFTLADLSGAVDSRKRQYANLVRGLLSDPGATLAQLAAVDAEAARGNRYTQMSAGSVMPEVAQQGQEAMLNAALNVGGLLGITAYHGSPHTFDKFDMSKIGTGEGAQAYGHGLYFAENPEVAGAYRKALSAEATINGKPLMKGGDMVGTTGDPAIDNLLRPYLMGGLTAEDAAKAAAASGDSKAAAKVRELAGSIKSGAGGHTYKVDIPDDAVAKMLDWDKPLSQQPEAVQKGVRKAFADAKIPDAWQSDPDGQSIHAWLSSAMGGKNNAELQRKGAEILKQHGIPGIRYLDAGSRGKGGTSNFVLFDDNLPKILSRE